MFSSKRKLNDIYFGGKKKSKSSDNNSNESSDSDTISRNITKPINRRNNHVYFHTEVTKESMCELIGLIHEAEEECYLMAFKMNIPPIPIYLHINSYGGSVFAAFGTIDVITSRRVPVYTIVEGATASAGTLLSIVGKKRYIRPTSYMLIHQLSSECGGKMNEIDDEYKNLQEIMVKIKELYKKYTNIPNKELNEILKHDLWLNADKCLKYGLVDELWTQ